VMILRQAYLGPKLSDLVMCIHCNICRHIGGGGSWLVNINLEQHARQDQIARVARATVAQVRVVGMRQVVWASRHTSQHCWKGLRKVYIRQVCTV
jgi:hypothetical protein